MLPLTLPLPVNPPPGIALFDLDGTLLAWDCQLLFRHHVLRREPWRIVFLPLFLLAAPFHRLLGDERLKRIYFSFLAGMNAETLAEHARTFAERLRPTIYQELLERVVEHRRNGDLLILASASPEFYVKSIGSMLGFDLTLGTTMDPARRVPLFPKLHNHKGAAKVRRLAQILPQSYFRGGRLVTSHGYTDSRADLPMLEICERATVVNPAPQLAALANTKGWEVVRPSRPWKSAVGRALRSVALLFGLSRDPGGLGDAIGLPKAGN